MSAVTSANPEGPSVAVGRWAPNMPADEWDAIESFVLAAATDCDGKVPMSARTAVQFASRIARWALRSGLPLEREVVFRRSTIGLYIQHECASQPKSTRNTYRSRLLRMGEVLAPAHQDDALPGLVRDSEIRPYSAAEQTAWRSWADGQRTPARRQDAKVLLALSIGAGLSGGEISEVRYENITVDAEGVLIQVAGERARVVPVLAPWEDILVAVAHLDCEPEGFVFRPTARRPNPNVVSHFTKKDGHLPSTYRMRTTWMVTQLIAGVPVKALLNAAGVQSFTSFERCISYLTEPDPILSRRLLRGTEVARV